MSLRITLFFGFAIARFLEKRTPPIYCQIILIKKASFQLSSAIQYVCARISSSNWQSICGLEANVASIVCTSIAFLSNKKTHISKHGFACCKKCVGFAICKAAHIFSRVVVDVLESAYWSYAFQTGAILNGEISAAKR